MEYIQLTMEDYKQSKEDIRQSLGSIVKRFVRIGWQLTRIDAAGAYKLDGYKDIAEFARAEYGMNASGASRFMSVYKRYSVPGDTPELQEKYREFEYHQLQEMLQLSEEDRELVTPGTSRESIREIKKFNKENENNPEMLLNWKTGVDERDKILETIEDFYRQKTGVLNALFESDAYREGDIKGMVEIVNPSGNRSHRKGIVFLMLNNADQGIMVKIFGKEKMEKMTWEEFFGCTRRIFGEAAAGSRTYERYFLGEQEEPEETDQIPGQDSILNHPELMPEETEAEPQEETEIAPAQKPEEKAAAPKKTEEQKYAEKQARLDRQTKERLQEREDEEKMNHLPSDTERPVFQFRMAASNFEYVLSGKRTFDLLKNEKDYREGDLLEYLEFREGRNTGRAIKVRVTYVLEDYTGIEEGFCVAAFKPEEEA